VITPLFNIFDSNIFEVILLLLGHTTLESQERRTPDPDKSGQINRVI